MIQNVIPAMNEKVVYELGVQQGELPRIIEAWIDAEDVPIVIASDVDDMIGEIEEGTSIEMERDEEMEEAVNVEATYVSWTKLGLPSFNCRN
jgi:hypothetical protein